MTATAVAERTAQTNIATHPASDTTSLLQVISRAASDPTVDIDKMERLLQMHERMTERSAKTAFTAALAEMQPKLPVIERKGMIRVPAKDGKTGHETPYALWEDINEAIRPLLAEYGFALTFRVKKEADRVEVTGVLSHREGHSEETTLSLPMDSTGSKNNVQAIGSSVQYGKRYTGSALLNITTRGEDDDGKTADPAIAINDQQRKELDGMLDTSGADLAKFLAFFGVEYLAELPASRFAEARNMLAQKMQRSGK